MNINELVIGDGAQTNALRIKQIAEERKKRQKQPEKKGFQLTDLLPTIGGVGGGIGGGAAGGALAGTAVLPGVGTAIGGLLGAILGGAGGSVLGKVSENALEGEKDIGKDVLGEAALGGATALPIGAGIKLARAGGALAKGNREVAGQLTREAGAQTIPRMAPGAQGRAAAEAGVAVPSTSRETAAGIDLQRRVAGTSKVADSYSREVGLVDALNRNNLTGSASKMYKNIDTRLGDLSKQIDERLTTIPGAATPRTDFIKSARERVTDLVPADTTYTREIDRTLQRIGKSGTGDVGAGELFRFKQELGNRLSPAFKKLDRGAPLTAKEEVDMALWRSLDDDITNLAPEVKQLTRDQSSLITARPGLQKASERTAKIPILGNESQRIEQVKQTAQNKLGRTLSGSTGTSGTPGGQTLTRATVRQATPRVLTGSFAGEQLTPVDELGLAPEDYEVLAAEGIDVPSASLDQAAQATGGEVVDTASNPFGVSRDEVAQSMVQALSSGDLKGFTALQQLYKTMGESKGNNLTALQKQSVGKVSTAEAILDRFEQMLAQRGGTNVGPLARLQGLAANAGAVTGFDQEAKVYNDLRQGLMSQLAKSLGESGAMAEGDIKRALALVPSLGETPQESTAKLSELRTLLTSMRQGITSSGGVPTSPQSPVMLEDALFAGY
ncbi:MAG: hypothetical protein LC803_09315 [Acidobacteria bacterium]|nr:hypothetical protein [Acidobacteriota bacterium]